MSRYTWNKWSALTAVVAPLIAMVCGAAPVHYVNLLNTGHDVPPYTNWATAALSIGDALAVTASGSMVRVAAGTYLPTISLAITNPNVRVESVSGARSTVVCGNGLFSLFTLMAPGAAVCGFTLTNGGRSSGGGVMAAAASTVERCIVTGNNVLGDGGGLFANSVAALQVSECMIVGNSADNGGGVYLQNAAAFVRNSICAFNSAPGKGAGIYAEKAMIDNCSVVSNTGQGLYLLQACTLNSIAYHNSAENIAGSSMALTNVCTMPDPGAGGVGVVTNNPCFVSASGDFRLLRASPCIDRGTPAGWMTDAVDQYSSPRVSGAAPDIGAAEFPYPYLDITSHVGIAIGSTNWVPFDVAALLLSGTNRYSITTNLYTNALTTNLVVVGGMWAVNAAQGATGVFPAALGWRAPEIPLQTGANAILVYGTNDVDGITNDILIVTRGADGTGTPCIDITNEAAARVNFDVTSYAIGGTNWQIAGGTLWWSNTLVAGATQFSASGMNGAFSPLINNMQVGANVIAVYGTNMLGVFAGDTITITRGADGTGTPCIDITNAAVASVNFEVTSCTIGGTNWQIAGGTLWWSNTLVAGATQFSASGVNGVFSPLINNVQVGTNVIAVYGTNMLGVFAGDTITIMRQATNMPVIEILVNWPLHLQAGQTGWVEFIAQTGVQYGLYTAAMLTNGTGPLASLVATNTNAILGFSVAQTQAGTYGPLLLYLAAMADMRSAMPLPRTNVFVATVGPAVIRGSLRFFQIVESDGDIVEVYYAGIGTPRMEGRSVFITGAGVADALYLKVTVPGKPTITDGRFPLDWVSAANLRSIRWRGQVDDIHISNVLKTVKIRAGSLGFTYDHRATSRHGLQVGAELKTVTVQAKKSRDGTYYGGSALGAFNVGPDAQAKGWTMKIFGISNKGLTGNVSTVTIDLYSHKLNTLMTKFADIIDTRVVVTNEIGMLAAIFANIYDSHVVARFLKTITATAKAGYPSGLIADSQFYSIGGNKNGIGIRAIKACQLVDGQATSSNICLRKTIFAAGIIPPLCTNNLTSTFSIKILKPKKPPLQGVFSSKLNFNNPPLHPAPAAPSYLKIINGVMP